MALPAGVLQRGVTFARTDAVALQAFFAFRIIIAGLLLDTVVGVAEKTQPQADLPLVQRPRGDAYPSDVAHHAADFPVVAVRVVLLKLMGPVGDGEIEETVVLRKKPVQLMPPVDGPPPEACRC